jgi:hypothetical protein
MKNLATSAVLLLSPVMVARSCTIVSKVEPSSQNARITVMMDGNPQKDVKVVVSTVEGQARLTITTDSQGVVSLPKLPPGKYCLAASAAPTLRADDLCLEVSRSRGRNPSSFSMILGVKPPPPPTFEEKLEAAGRVPVRTHTQVFAGVVEDPAGAVIPRTQVAVYQRGSTGKGQPLKLTTDEDGRFTAQLAPGIYIGVFQSFGFQTEFVPFEIAKEGSKEDLRVKLMIASMGCS